MSIVKTWALAGSLVVALAGTAFAADMPIPVPPPPLPHFGGWYLRGDIGFTNQRVDDLDNPNYAVVSNLRHVDKDFDSSGFGGVGVGYRVNNWLRFDVTGEYRSSAHFHGADTFDYFDGTLDRTASDDYSASKHEWTGLLNAYLDLGTWRGVTPFIGGGIGASRNTISGFHDTGLSIDTDGVSYPSFGYAGSHSKWDFAWALQAGLAYAVTDRLSMEFAYRYIDLGDAETGRLRDISGNGFGTMTFKDLTSNDFKVGLRYALDVPAPPPAPDLLTGPPPCPGVCK